MQPGSEGGKILDPSAVRSKNKAEVEELEEEDETKQAEAPELPEDEDEEMTEEEAEELMGEQPVDNVILDHLVDQLEELLKDDIKAIAQEHGIDDSGNKAPLIARVAEELAKKGFTELPDGDA
jgi:hypothetical protein